MQLQRSKVYSVEFGSTLHQLGNIYGATKSQVGCGLALYTHNAIAEVKGYSRLALIGRKKVLNAVMYPAIPSPTIEETEEGR